MSEKEKKKRVAYRKNREKWIFAQSVIVVVLALAVLISALVSAELNKKYYMLCNTLPRCGNPRSFTGSKLFRVFRACLVLLHLIFFQ